MAASLLSRAVVLGALASVAVALISPASGDAQRPRELVRIPFPQDDGSLTPYSFELGYPLVTLIYDTLLWRDADGRPQPWLATAVERRAGGTNLTVRLRGGVRWHDGEPLTSADVAFTFDFVRRNRHFRFTPQLREVESVRTQGPRAVVIQLRRPVLGFLDQPLSDVPILPRHLWEGRSGSQLVPPGPPIGSGPYRLDSYGPGRGYIFTANSSYFRGRPRVERIEVPIIRNAARTFESLERGNVDMVPAGLTADNSRQLEEDLGIDVRQGVNYSGTALVFNLRSRPFDRAAVRRAAARALDLPRIAQAVVEAIPATKGFLHPDSEWAPDPGLYRTDVARARPVLSELRRPIQILAPENSPVRVEAGRQAVFALRRAGARARLTEVSRQALGRALGGDGSRPTFQAAITSIPALASYDPDYLRVLFGSRSPINQAGYRSGAFDQLAERVTGARTRHSRLDAVAAEMRRLARDVPAVPLVFADGAFAYRQAVYADWIFVKGVGILDKRSFLPGQRGLARELPVAGPAKDDDDGFPLGPFGIAAVALMAIVIALSAAALSHRRSGVR
jgi:peptide/nickel transport system substrate-binding protein